MEKFSEADALATMNEEWRLEQGLDSSGRRQFAPLATPLEEVQRAWWDFRRLHNIEQEVSPPHWTGTRWAASARLGGYSRQFALRWRANWQPAGFSLRSIGKKVYDRPDLAAWADYDPAAGPVEKHQFSREEARLGAAVAARAGELRRTRRYPRGFERWDSVIDARKELGLPPKY